MGKRGTAVGETEAQICLLCGKLFHEVRRYRQDDPLMDGIVDQELFAAADGIIDLIAVMDVHVHGFFFFI